MTRSKLPADQEKQLVSARSHELGRDTTVLSPTLRRMIDDTSCTSTASRVSERDL